MGAIEEVPRINKILEIDLDTERENLLQVFMVSETARPRSRPPDKDYNIKDNMIMCAIATHAAIMACEDSGLYQKGAAIRQVIDNLQNLYIDAGQSLSSSSLPEQAPHLVDTDTYISTKSKADRLKELQSNIEFHKKCIDRLNNNIAELQKDSN